MLLCVYGKGRRVMEWQEQRSKGAREGGRVGDGIEIDCVNERRNTRPAQLITSQCVQEFVDGGWLRSALRELLPLPVRDLLRFAIVDDPPPPSSLLLSLTLVFVVLFASCCLFQ
jgi:hypothetical protein